jgi:hypothetical protein
MLNVIDEINSNYEEKETMRPQPFSVLNVNKFSHGVPFDIKNMIPIQQQPHVLGIHGQKI